MKNLIMFMTIALATSLSYADDDSEKISCSSGGASFEATMVDGANQTYLENVKLKENNKAVKCSTCNGVYLLQGSTVLAIYLDAPDQENRTVVEIKKNKVTKKLEYYSNAKLVGEAQCEGLY